MKPLQQLQLQTLDQHLAGVSVCDRPTDGWIRAVRKALGMSTRQLAARMRLKQQSLTKLESNEAEDSITLKKLREAAEAMDCRLVYAFVPNDGSLQAMVKKQAVAKARSLVSAVNHSMRLEDQEVGNLEAKVQQTAEEFMQNITPRLWDK